MDVATDVVCGARASHISRHPIRSERDHGMDVWAAGPLNADVPFDVNVGSVGC